MTEARRVIIPVLPGHRESRSKVRSLCRTMSRDRTFETIHTRDGCLSHCSTCRCLVLKSCVERVSEEHTTLDATRRLPDALWPGLWCLDEGGRRRCPDLSRVLDPLCKRLCGPESCGGTVHQPLN
jgi:hypothetical protein